MDNDLSTSTFVGRLKQLVANYGSANALAKAIGRSEGALRNWLTGRSEPTVSNVLALCRETGTRIEWLMIGREPRRETSDHDAQELREDGGPYLHAVMPDEMLLRNITEALELELAGAGITAAKKAELIVSCYHFIGAAEKFDPAVVRRLVKLAT